ncbi:BTAD domain-containing putative transcriptional regulator [Pseudonocardia broussonetiae]|uniref:Transcriptional regulator n=1 Tax=Pseudonocardia broussonetiae TaxID=2736640 RepID=A0A6M6JKL6_9PSEU|nr:BTAD domain-containing putative transcriptional regulator [Pseudonocardia broussonetiae]QJY48694.1 transcriptional regulator [Pseudonocardia broussonetiae]
MTEGPAVRVGLLGPLHLFVDGTGREVPGPKRRAVLALLALQPGRTVTVEHLVDALWPSEVPESGRQALHTHVSRLRGHLGAAADRLQTRREGYRLELRDDELDVARARALLTSARGAGAGDPAAALGLLREAHALWRGPVLADLTDVAPLAAAAQEYARLHRDVTDALVAAAVDAGRAAEAQDLAAAALAADPLREPAALLLMRVLAATGRTAEALRTGRDHRHRLAEETGLDPSPALGELERRIAGGAAGPAPAPAPSPAGPTTRLVGREATVAALHRLLSSERLVTLVGPGGVGKTRVAAEVARGSGQAPVLLLAPVTDPAAVPHALASALGLHVVHGDVLAACLAVLGDRRGLLVVDNCEHLLDAARDTVEAVLSACPGLSVLATSREPLGTAAEHVSRLAPLGLPGRDQDPRNAPAVTAFLDRAERVRTGPAPTAAELEVIAEIVRGLDGMPLAIELAAGRLSTFSLVDLRDRLDRSLDLLGGGRRPDDRHRTLRATVEWSYQLLSGDEQRLFRYLSVFADGVDLADAERLAADLAPGTDPGSLLARLVDASVVEADFTGRTRYRLLETLRAYGRDRLAAGGEAGDAAARLVRWAAALATWFAATAVTEDEPVADAVLRREVANLRAAWQAAREDPDAAAVIVAGLFPAVGYRDLTEIRGWAEELAADPRLVGRQARAAVLGTAAEAAYQRGDLARAERWAREGLASAAGGAGTAYCLGPLSVVDLARGAFADAAEHALAAAAEGLGEALGIAALATAYGGDRETARALVAEAAAGAGSPTVRAWNAYVTAEIDSAAGDAAAAEAHYLDAVDLARTAGATFLVGVATVGLLTVRASAGRVREALGGYREVVDYFDRTGNWTHQWTTLRNLAGLLRRLGDGGTADMLEAAADRAPDAPAVGTGPTSAGPVLGRRAVLDLARQAIDRHLGG